jgi:hypothetical protein
MNNSILSILKKGIWIYFFLLIFEGAIRRWLLPNLSNPILLIRDVLSFFLLIIALRNNYNPNNRLVTIIFCVGLISIFTALFFGHGNLLVALFGARILMIQFPMLFLIGHVLNRQDVISMGKIILWIAIPMAILITVQFYSPQNAWINKGIGENIDGAGFSGANGYFRPPGTFSFTSGNVNFFSLVSCVVLYFWLKPKKINKYLLFASSLALIVAIPTSISRSLFFQFIISILFFIWVKISQPGFIKNITHLLTAFFVILILAINVNLIDNQVNTLIQRFDNAERSEGGIEGTIVNRFLGGLLYSFQSVDDQHIFFGYGIGMGTNVGSKLLTGELKFLISEGEWGRIFGEIGMILGLTFIFIRVYMSFNYLHESIKYLKKDDPFPWMLMSSGFIILSQQQLSQPTNLGFFVLIGGLVLATLKKEENELQ